MATLKGYCEARHAANYTGVAYNDLLKATESGEVSYIMSGRKRLVKAADVLKYMERRGKKLPADNKQSHNKRADYSPQQAKERICLTCGKQFTGKQQLCRTCNTRWRQVGEWRAPISALLTVKKWYPDENPFDIIQQTPAILCRVYDETGYYERRKTAKKATFSATSKRQLAKDYTGKDRIPGFIQDFFSGDESKELLFVTGSKKDPDVHYLCKRCGKEQLQRYSSLTVGQGHNCDSVKSSGEAVIEGFLKDNGIPYCTQRETLKCVNPETGAVMPYDFELVQSKVIIEVQGEQHFRYIPYFHGSLENFEYAQRKDRFKKAFAESQGYDVLCISYDDISSGRYQRMIQNANKVNM